MFGVEMVFAFFAVAGFSILFNIPRRLLVTASLVGMIGWFVYSAVNWLGNGDPLTSALCGSFAIGILGELMARYKKVPASLYIIPGIIPIVPGYGLYYTMLYAVQNKYEAASAKGFESLLVTVSIACGIVMATSVMRIGSKTQG